MQAHFLKRYRWWLAIPVIFAGCAGFLWYETEKGWTPKKIEQAVHENVPPGATRAQVEAWIDSIPSDSTCRVYHDYFNFDIAPFRDHLDTIGNQTVVELSGLPRDQVKSMVRAPFAGANVDLIWGGRVTVYFFFDRNDRLLGYFMDTFVASP
jgi:hypothetical protein